MAFQGMRGFFVEFDAISEGVQSISAFCSHGMRVRTEGLAHAFNKERLFPLQEEFWVFEVHLLRELDALIDNVPLQVYIRRNVSSGLLREWYGLEL